MGVGRWCSAPGDGCVGDGCVGYGCVGEGAGVGEGVGECSGEWEGEGEGEGEGEDVILRVQDMILCVVETGFSAYLDIFEGT
ncbi:hypothetical protein Tco_0406241 [Tanacetum coccineum]